MRNFLGVLLVLALLPWGAWAAAVASGQPDVAAGQNGFHMEVTDGATALSRVDRATEVKSAKRCRKATLPGLTCAPEPAINTTQIQGVTGLRQAVREPWAAHVATGRDEVPPKEPPRVL